MDFPELTKLAFSRVQKVEPENVGKILGCILLREPDEEEMVQLAYGTDSDLLSVIADAKATLAAINARQQRYHQIRSHRGAVDGYNNHPPVVGAGVHHFSPAAFGFHAHQSHYWPAPADSSGPDYRLQAALVDPTSTIAEGHYASSFQNKNAAGDHNHLYDAFGGGGAYYYATAAAEDHHTFHHCGGGGDGGGRAASSRRPNNGLSTTTSRRPCHYFFKGVCKNGQNCHYSHHHHSGDGLGGGDEHHHHRHHNDNNNATTTPVGLETLELEIAELLHSRRGQPVSIASLPTLYGEKYGKGLQADGYLTESQRHGKAGYSLTKLLSRLNKIRVIERPHGQHSVVLAEDAARYTQSRAERGNELGSVQASSHQIYLTFPAQSIFTEEDVANYFGQYGPVRDVRIPCQERRMFGFVSFQSPDTVSTILMRGNPHFICGSRVLVKPYREKSKCIERTTYVDKMKPMHYYPTRFFEVDPQDFCAEYDASSRLMRKQLAEKRERLIEMERKRFAGMRLESFPPRLAYFDCSIEDVRPLNSLPADSKDVDLMHHPVVVLDPLNVVSTSQAPPQWQQTSNNNDDQESNEIELLPDSPFASSAPAGNNISAAI